MFTKPKAKSKIEQELDRAFQDLRAQTTQQGYLDILDRVSKLQKLQAETQPKPMSRDTLVLAATNLLGIVLIIRHENVNVITSKALGFVQKPR